MPIAVVVSFDDCSVGAGLVPALCHGGHEGHPYIVVNDSPH